MAADCDSANSAVTLTDELKVQALIARYACATESLRALTAFDLQIFGGYVALQAGLGAWVAGNRAALGDALVGLGLIDLAIVLLAVKLLHNNFRRRMEYVDDLWVTLVALRFFESGVYVAHKALDCRRQPRWWFWWYVLGIGLGAFGMALVMGMRITWPG